MRRLLLIGAAAGSRREQIEDALRILLKNIAEEGEQLDASVDSARSSCKKHLQHVAGWIRHERELLDKAKGALRAATTDVIDKITSEEEESSSSSSSDGAGDAAIHGSTAFVSVADSTTSAAGGTGEDLSPMAMRRRRMAASSDSSLVNLYTALSQECDGKTLTKYVSLESNMRMDASAAITKALSVLSTLSGASNSEGMLIETTADRSKDESTSILNKQKASVEEGEVEEEEGDSSSSNPGENGPFIHSAVISATSFLQESSLSSSTPAGLDQGLRRLIHAGQILEASNSAPTAKVQNLLKQLAHNDTLKVKETSQHNIKDCGRSLRKQLAYIADLKSRVESLQLLLSRFDVEGKQVLGSLTQMASDIENLAPEIQEISGKWRASLKDIAERRAPLAQHIVVQAMKALQHELSVNAANVTTTATLPGNNEGGGGEASEAIAGALSALHAAAVVFEEQKKVQVPDTKSIQAVYQAAKKALGEVKKNLTVLQSSGDAESDEKSLLEDETREAQASLEEAEIFRQELKKTCSDSVKGAQRRGQTRMGILESEEKIFQNELEQKELESIR